MTSVEEVRTSCANFGRAETQRQTPVRRGLETAGMCGTSCHRHRFRSSGALAGAGRAENSARHAARAVDLRFCGISRPFALRIRGSDEGSRTRRVPTALWSESCSTPPATADGRSGSRPQGPVEIAIRAAIAVSPPRIRDSDAVADAVRRLCPASRWPGTTCGSVGPVPVVLSLRSSHGMLPLQDIS